MWNLLWAKGNSKQIFQKKIPYNTMRTIAELLELFIIKVLRLELKYEKHSNNDKNILVIRTISIVQIQT